MREEPGALRLIGFVLVIAGTLGLLLNEFVFDWGRTATIVFAVSNVVGLLGLWFSFAKRS
ncbi:MAG: hypothetical protein U1F44_08625 [Coriobacteriia bacterium]|nr:hypothetical protein [Coriobacteriia bacterium]